MKKIEIQEIDPGPAARLRKLAKRLGLTPKEADAFAGIRSNDRIEKIKRTFGVDEAGARRILGIGKEKE